MQESDKIRPVKLEDELNRSYLDYAMSVIVGRALPDVRDGLKPVHRRTLFAMNELRNTHNRPYIKSARVVGEVIGKYHPHGDTAVYDTIVRMAQEFSMRVPLVDGQGNFGSVDGDQPAAQRYTEVKMTRFAAALLEDLDKDTVGFVPNYDDTLEMPEVLPSRAPNLLINGSAGIAVGMATNIPPHNPSEVIAACLALLDDPELSVDDLMEHIQGPDFPTGASINGRAGILIGYRTGRSSILIRSKAEIITDDKGKETIIVHEIPYQVNKAEMIAKIAVLVKEKKLEGITEIRDESNKDGIRVVIEVRRSDSAEVILNNLYTKTQLQKSYGINMLALVAGRPQQLNLKEVLACFLQHRREVVIRRTRYLLRQARARGHVLEGQLVALTNIDQVVELIKNSPDTQAAREGLMAIGWQSGSIDELLARTDPNICRPDGLPQQFGYRDGAYHLSEQQAQSILELRLHRLTGLEQDKILSEYSELVETVTAYQLILSDSHRRTEVIRNELLEVAENYTEERRTDIMESQQDIDYEDLIDPEDRVVMVSRKGYTKARPIDDYETIGRGGRGRSLAVIQDDDFVQQTLVANTHDTILCFSSAGKVYWLKVYQIPIQGRQSRGRPLVNLLQLDEGEQITAFLPFGKHDENKFIFMSTAFGTVKKTPLEQFMRRRNSGLIALSLDENNTLVNAAITDGNKDILMISNAGKAVRFHESDVRAVGRTARGVRGMNIAKGDRIISMMVVDPEQELLIASENGYGKRLAWSEFRTKSRGTKGTIVMRTNVRNGALMAAVQVTPKQGQEVVLMSDQGRLLRTEVARITQQSRLTQGVRLMKLPAGEKLVSVHSIGSQELNEEGSDTAEAAEGTHVGTEESQD